MIRYIGIAGRIGSGKSTLANGLEGLAPRLWPGAVFVQLGFADLIKEFCIAQLGVPRELAYGTQEDKARIWQNGMSVRGVFRTIGKAYCDVEPAFWVRKAFESAHAYLYKAKEGVVVFSDVRFPIEADWIHMRGGKILRLSGKLASEAEHYTETSVDGLTVDCEIDMPERTKDVTLALAVRYLMREGMVHASCL